MWTLNLRMHLIKKLQYLFLFILKEICSYAYMFILKSEYDLMFPCLTIILWFIVLIFRVCFLSQKCWMMVSWEVNWKMKCLCMSLALMVTMGHDLTLDLYLTLRWESPWFNLVVGNMVNPMFTPGQEVNRSIDKV